MGDCGRSGKGWPGASPLLSAFSSRPVSQATLRARAAGAPATLRPSGAAVPLPPPPKPVRRAPAGTLVACACAAAPSRIRSAPNGPVVAQLSSRDAVRVARHLRGHPAGHGLRVITTELPNGRTGWVDAHGALRLSRTTVSLDVDLSSRLLAAFASPAASPARCGVGIGRRAPLTPTGRFAITDKLRGSAYSSVYGCCILALSGPPDEPPARLDGRRPPRDPRRLDRGRRQRRAASHADEAGLRYLMRVVPLGAQITIHP